MKAIGEQRITLLSKAYHQLVEAEPVLFSRLVPSRLPERAGVYLTSRAVPGPEIPYYIGRSKNLRRRIYTNHLMGPFSNARLKKHLVAAQECSDISAAKQFLRDRCAVRWMFEDSFRERGALEAYATAMLFPLYGIDEEH